MCEWQGKKYNNNSYTRNPHTNHTFISAGSNQLGAQLLQSAIARGMVQNARAAYRAEPVEMNV